MKLTYVANGIQDTYFLHVTTMFGDADMYKDAKVQIASADIEKTLTEFVIFKEFMDSHQRESLSEILYERLENEDLNGHFDWLNDFSYEYDLNSYGRVENYSLEYFDHNGQKFDVTISDILDITKVFKNKDATDDYLESAMTLLEKMKLDNLIEEGKNPSQKLKM
jgi:hypothetical protein